jgi:limonene 1,2-monooxygenase
MAMRLKDGIFLAPFHPLDEDPTLCIQRDLELIEHLDRLGYEEAWVGEHHSGGFEIIASPEVFIAGAAERTKRIRLGTGVVSLPYHNPLTTANRILQLDHQTRGRVMFGVGPGLLPSDAFQLGISPGQTRDRMVEGIEVILRLFAGERVTHHSDWFDLVDATCQLKPYTWPHPEIAVASSVTPSGGTLAGRHGFGLLCVAATQHHGYDALGVNWKIAQETAAAHGQVMDPSRLRLVGPVHIAPTREEAWANVQFGGRQFAEYFARISRPGQPVDTSGDPIRKMVDDGAAVVGTPDDAIAQIKRLQAKQGEFGVFLQLAHNWANFEKTKASYELWRRYASPAINNVNAPRQDSFDWATGHAPEFIKAAAEAAASTIAKYQAASQAPRPAKVA